jgi:hypothetical protein
MASPRAKRRVYIPVRCAARNRETSTLFGGAGEDRNE